MNPITPRRAALLIALIFTVDGPAWSAGQVLEISLTAPRAPLSAPAAGLMASVLTPGLLTNAAAPALAVAAAAIAPSAPAPAVSAEAAAALPSAAPAHAAALAQARTNPAAAQAADAGNIFDGRAGAKTAAARPAARKDSVLVVDIGGTHVKILATGHRTPRKIPSGPAMTASRMAREVKLAAKDWKYDRVAVGYPGPVVAGRPERDPANLGPGWKKFDFAAAFGRPVKLINDAAMQALGSYRKGRMLFLGLGTGLGSALIVDGHLQPLELAHLPYKKGMVYEDYLGLRGLERLGKKRWRREVLKVTEMLKQAMQVDEVVLGGGNARIMDKVPPGVRLGSNEKAFVGGFRLWKAP